MSEQAMNQTASAESTKKAPIMSGVGLKQPLVQVNVFQNNTFIGP